MHIFKVIFLLLILNLAPTALAQNDCPAIVKAALNATDKSCTTIGRNQVCYGNIQLKATLYNGASLTFDKAGDIVNVADLKTLQLSSMSLSDQSWGVALMKIQANLPNTLPGQNVTFLLFGNVSISDNRDPIVELPVSTTTGVNVRIRPTANASIISSLKNGQSIIATGRLADQSWIRVRLDDASEGWISAGFLKGEMQNLLPTKPGTTVFGPMQSFTFTSGIDDRSCDQAPDSGILIQSPKGAGTVQLRVNEVDIRLGSTAYLQAGNGFMTISVVEGAATIEAQGVQQRIPAGTYSRIQLASNGLASASPEYPRPYDYATLKTLPVQIALPKIITIATPIPVADVPAAINTASRGQPANGRWANTDTVSENTCDPNKLPPGHVTTAYPAFTFSEDHSSFVLDWGNGEAYTFTLTSGTTYITHRNPRETWTITFTSATSYSSALRGDYGTCIYSQSSTGAYVG